MDMSTIYACLDIETDVNRSLIETYSEDDEVFSQPKLPPDPADNPPKPRADWKPETNAKKLREWEEQLPQLRAAWQQECDAAHIAHDEKQLHEAALNPLLGEIVCAATWAPPQPNLPDGLQLTFSLRNLQVGDIIEKVWETLMPGDNGMRIVGHNVRKFDIVWLHLQAEMTQAMTEGKRHSVRAYYDPWAARYLYPQIIDMLDFIPNKLSLISKALLNEGKAPISDKIHQLREAGDWDTIEQGCLQHARLEFTCMQRLGFIPQF